MRILLAILAAIAAARLATTAATFGGAINLARTIPCLAAWAIEVGTTTHADPVDLLPDITATVMNAVATGSCPDEP